MSIELLLTGVLQGLILALVAFGVMVALRLLNFPDLASEGSYPFAGALCSSLIIMDISPIIAVSIATIAAGMVGVATAMINLKLKINTLLCGIIISTILYSANLRIMGKPNIALFNHDILLSGNNILNKIFIMIFIIFIVVFPLALFLKTEFGLRLRAVGLNIEFCKRQKISVAKYTLLGLFLAHCYVGMAGSLMVQLQSYMDIGMGVGIVIHALAALMIGESVIGNNTLNRQLMAPIIGALIYQQIQGLALVVGFAPSDLKGLTGIVVLGVIALRKNKI